MGPANMIELAPSQTTHLEPKRNIEVYVTTLVACVWRGGGLQRSCQHILQPGIGEVYV